MLLKVVTNFIPMPFEFKRWSILPVAQHGIGNFLLFLYNSHMFLTKTAVHVPLSGQIILYNLLRRCARAGYNIPRELLIQEFNFETNQVILHQVKCTSI